MHVYHVYRYISTYRERDKEKERERERERVHARGRVGVPAVPGLRERERERERERKRERERRGGETSLPLTLLKQKRESERDGAVTCKDSPEVRPSSAGQSSGGRPKLELPENFVRTTCQAAEEATLEPEQALVACGPVPPAREAACCVTAEPKSREELIARLKSDIQ